MDLSIVVVAAAGLAALVALLAAFPALRGLLLGWKADVSYALECVEPGEEEREFLGRHPDAVPFQQFLAGVQARGEGWQAGALAVMDKAAALAREHPGLPMYAHSVRMREYARWLF